MFSASLLNLSFIRHKHLKILPHQFIGPTFANSVNLLAWQQQNAD